MVEQLRQYLSGKGYFNWGVQLLRQLGHDRDELKVLESYTQKPFAPQSIETQVNLLIQRYFEQLSNSENRPNPPNNAPESYIPSSEPTVISALRAESKQLQNDRRAIHLGISEKDRLEERYQKAIHIRQLTKRIDKIWLMIDAYELDGSVPIEGVVKERSAVQEAVNLSSKVNSLRPRISKLKKLIEDKSTPLSKKERYKAEQASKEAELKDILKKLQDLKDE